MSEIPIVLAAIAALAVVVLPLVGGKRGPSEGKASGPTAGEHEKLLDRKQRLLVALRDLDQERAAGQIAEGDYQQLKAKYEVEAAAVIRALDEAKRARKSVDKRSPRGAKAKPAAGRRSVGRTALWVGAIAGFFGLTALALSGAIRPRTPGSTITGVDVQNTAQPAPEQPSWSPDALPEAQRERFFALQARLAADSTDLEALLGLSHLYLSQQQLEPAATISMRALEVDSTAWEAHAHIAMVYWGHGEAEDALDIIEAVLRLSPDLPEALLYKGMMLYGGGRDPAGAIRAWERYLRVVPPGSADTVRVKALIAAARNTLSQ
jgi:tetratricopeptide (TPR) repeat protein